MRRHAARATFSTIYASAATPRAATARPEGRGKTSRAIARRDVRTLARARCVRAELCGARRRGGGEAARRRRFVKTRESEVFDAKSSATMGHKTKSTRFEAKSKHAGLDDLDLLDRAVAARRRVGFDGAHHVHPLHDVPEHDVLAV